MSAMLITSHPAPVREAIEEHRRRLDADPIEYLEKNNEALTESALRAAGGYLGIDPSHIALTDSTTMGVGLVYNGLRLRPGDDILTTEEDYYVTHESLRLLAGKTGAKVRKIRLFEAVENTNEDEIVGHIAEAILPTTRLVALTWVHSSTGLKIPVAAIADALREINQSREEEHHVLLGIDGVHGFGVEHAGFEELGCDFLMAGCHKWLFGPRGTGIIAFSERGLGAVGSSIPSFTDSAVFNAWVEKRDEPKGVNSGPRMTPGGFKAFEHRWALTQAFELHRQIGKDRVAARTHELASALKEALLGINGVILRTPRNPSLSAG
jgi:selenocysteine lyase/cysteine desulfurase